MMKTMKTPSNTGDEWRSQFISILSLLISTFFIRHCQSFQVCNTLKRGNGVRITLPPQQLDLDHSLSKLWLSSQALSASVDTRPVVATGATIFDQEQQRRVDSSSRTLSYAAQWHRQRRQEMLQKYGDQIAPLERNSNSQAIGLTFLIISNLTLALLSIVSGSLPIWQVVLISLFPGSILSLWQLQILHDNIHGCLLDKQKQSFSIWPSVSMSKRQLQDAITFWGSMPSVFGYYLYLKYGHLSHHAFLGSASLEQVFESSSRDLDDGDILFVSHRMKLLGKIGPKLSWNTQKENTHTNHSNNNQEAKSITMSISRTGFSFWKPDQAVWNAAVFSTSFMFERALLVVNDLVVALTGRNFFFPNKPAEFQEACATYSRCAVLIRLLLLVVGGSWKSLLFLYLAETLWSLPPHPACAMFITNHGSNHHTEEASSVGTACIPSSSTYAGGWYSILTLGTNYHTEHHDFPTIPFHKLGRLHEIAPEYYTLQRSSDTPIVDNLWKVMAEAFAKPNYYACMNDLHLAATDGSSQQVPVDSLSLPGPERQAN